MEPNVAQLTPVERLWAWFESNRKPVVTGTAVVIVAGAAIAFYFWHQGESEADASRDLSTVMAPLTMPGGNRLESADAYLKVAAEHAGTAAAGRAVLQAAGVLFAQQKYAEAQTQFERFLRENPDSLFRIEAQFGIAVCLDVLGKTEEAARAYKDLAERHPNESVTPQARFALARIYEQQNKLSDAYNLFQQVAQMDAGGAVGLEAAMKAEELKPKVETPALLSPVAPPKPLTAPMLLNKTNATRP